MKLVRDKSGVSVDPTLYRSVIGNLLYMTANPLDICYNVGIGARYQSNPKKSHITDVKRIIRYTSGTLDYEIWYSKDTNISLAGFSYADWAGNADDRKSTSRACFYLRIVLESFFVFCNNQAY